ncbi:MerR family transcriptional regulator, partial [Actinomadura sp. NPDC000929]|uniref:MerR family transcriptional regulator n=1 Tax=Actinomadura sp. NPDC000929 TaxID=3154517 RepID=UPI0033979705
MRGETDREPGLGVGAVARRLGLAAATLRTWDRRYGIGPSGRSPGGHRRYTPADVARLEAMQRLILAGAGWPRRPPASCWPTRRPCARCWSAPRSPTLRC